VRVKGFILNGFVIDTIKRSNLLTFPDANIQLLVLKFRVQTIVKNLTQLAALSL